MPRKRYTSEQIIVTLREAEVELAKGQRRVEVCRKLGIRKQTYYRWRKEYGSLGVDQVRHPKDLERENARLKKLVAAQALDLAILKEEITEPVPTTAGGEACLPGVGAVSLHAAASNLTAE
jgi:putative transposase